MLITFQELSLLVNYYFEGLSSLNLALTPLLALNETCISHHRNMLCLEDSIN